LEVVRILPDYGRTCRDSGILDFLQDFSFVGFLLLFS
jgi:hypothetical protein